MPTADAAIAHYSDSSPAATTGFRTAKWQQSAPYSGSLVWQGQTYTVNFTDISVEFPNVGGVDARTTATETIAAASQGKLVTLSFAGAIAVTLDSSVPNYFIAAVKITGGGTPTLTPSSGQINGASNLAITSDGFLFFSGTNWWFVGGGGGTPGGSNKQIQFNDSSAFGGAATVTWDKTTSILDASGASQVKVPTASPGDNTTKAASTAFVTAAINPIPSAGLPAWLRGHPDNYPASPSAVDDEFETGSSINLSQWTAVNGTVTTSQANSRVFINSASNGNNNTIRGWEQTAPGGNWTIGIKIYFSRVNPSGSINALGLLLRESATNKCMVFYFGANTVPLIGGDNWNSPTSFSGNFLAPLATNFFDHYYLWCTYDGTNYTFFTGESGVPMQAQSIRSKTSFFTTAADRFGIFFYDPTSGQKMSWEFFRKS